MLRNAFAYITRKWPKSLLLFAIILLMGTLSLIGLSMKGATQQASSESLGSITNSFSMQINRRTNPGTPRGAGNIRGEDIEKISNRFRIVCAGATADDDWHMICSVCRFQRNSTQIQNLENVWITKLILQCHT